MNVARFFFHKLADVLSANNLYLTKSLNYKREPAPLPINLDYVRYATLGLCAQEILRKNVPGNVAKVGGAHQAVLDFCQSHGVSFTSLPDSGGTAVLSK